MKGTDFTIKNKQGFTLMEVMIALTIFALFTVAFVTSQGFNIADSATFKEEAILRELAEREINEITNNPPKLEDTLTSAPEERKFEDYPEYISKITYRKFTVPDLRKLKGQEEGEEQEESPGDKIIYENMKKNLEKLIWQIEVEVTHKDSGRTFFLNKWFNNPEGEAKIEGI